MKHRIFLGVTLIALAIALPAKELPVPSSIAAAKVFLSGAEVTRTGKVNLPAGTSTIVFNKLSAELDPANIQVNGQGAFTILGVRHRLNSFDSTTTKAEIKTIEARIKSLAAEITREQADIDLLSKEEARLEKNELFGGDKGVSMEELQRMNEYMQRRLEAISASTISKNERIAALNETLNEQHRKLVEARGRKPLPTSEVLVDVTCTAPVEARLTLKYLVRSAGWTPSYDVRVKDISRPLELAYKALVYQSSGEDWSEVMLSLSSGEPKKGAVMPVLSTWLLDFGMPRVSSAAPTPYRPGVRDVRGFVRDERTGEALPFVNIVVVDELGNTLNGTTTDFEGYYALAIPENGKELRFSYVGYKTQGTPVSAGVINQGLAQDALSLQQVEVSHYKTPLLDKDGGASVSSISRESIQRIPAIGGEADRAAYMHASPGVVNTAGRGGRTENTDYYIDGVKVSTGGVPANYGALTGGVIDADRGLAERASRRAVNFEFKVDVPYTIPSDGQSHTVAVREERMNAEYRHYCTPKLDLDAFLFAKVTGWDTLNLLAGDAQIYFEDTYVGTSRLDPNATGDTLDLSLGRDKGITVQRTKRTDFSQKQVIGGKRTDKVSWEIAVRNNKAQPVQLIITDQFPVSVRSEIEVELLENSEAKVNTDKGLLTWKRPLEPRSDQSWTFSYSVKYPKEGLVVLE